MRPCVSQSLLQGDFNEDDSHASFADALSSWRSKAGPTAVSLPGSGPNAAPGEAPLTSLEFLFRLYKLVLTNYVVLCSPGSQTHRRLPWTIQEGSVSPVVIQLLFGCTLCVLLQCIMSNCSHSLPCVANLRKNAGRQTDNAAWTWEAFV